MHLQSTCGRTPLPVYHHEHRRASVNLRGLRALIANCSLEAIDFAISNHCIYYCTSTVLLCDALLNNRKKATERPKAAESAEQRSGALQIACICKALN